MQIDLKLRYNALLQRYHRGALYMENETVAVSEREKYVPALFTITCELSTLLADIGGYTDEEVLNGFTIELAS